MLESSKSFYMIFENIEKVEWPCRRPNMADQRSSSDVRAGSNIRFSIPLFYGHKVRTFVDVPIKKNPENITA